MSESLLKVYIMCNAFELTWFAVHDLLLLPPTHEHLVKATIG